MSGESAQDIEVSITAPNRSFHATVIASDVSWQDRPFGSATVAADQSSQPRRPIWSSAFGDSIDTVDTVDSESYDPMVNSTTSLSQDSLYDGFAVEFISSSTKESSYMNGGVATGAGVESATTAPAALEAAAAAFTAPTAASDAVSTSIEMRPVGFAETDRGSISCEMITPKPVLVGDGNVPTGESTVTSTSTTTTVTESTVTSSGQAPVATSTVSSSEQTTVTSSGTGTDITVTSSSATLTEDSEMTTHVPMAPGSTFQMAFMEADEEHAEAPERPRDRAMSLHERSLLAHDMHTLSSTMDTIKDEDEEVRVGSSSDEEKQEKRIEESYTVDRRVSLTGVPISATTFIAPSQPTIFEVAETAAAAVAAAAEAAAPAAAGDAAAAVVDEPSPYLKKLLDAQEATRQLMALLGESTQMLGTLPTSKPEKEAQHETEQTASDTAAATSAVAAATETASSMSFTSQSSSSMMSSSAFSSSTTGVAADSGAAATTGAHTIDSTTKAVPVSPTAAAPAATPTELAPPATPTAGGPPSPALEISSRPIDITFDDGSVVVPAVAAEPASADVPVCVQQPEEPATNNKDATSVPAVSTEIPVTVWQPEVNAAAAPVVDSAQSADAVRPTEIPVSVWQPEVDAAPAAYPTQTPSAPSFSVSAPPLDGTQNASIVSALENLAANMTTVTTKDAPSDGSQNESICNAFGKLETTTVTTTKEESSTTVTTDAPVTLGTPVQLQPATSPTISLLEPVPSSPAGDRPVTPTPASMLHESTMSSLAVDLPTPRLTPEPDQERFVTNNEQSEATMSKSSFSYESSSHSSSTEVASTTTASTTDYVLPTTTSIVLTEADETKDAVTAQPPASPSTPTVTTDAPVTLGTPVQLQPATSTSSLSELAPASPAGDRSVTPTPASMLHESTMSSLNVDLPTPRLTPEPDQERFVTNNEQSEATMTKSSFSFESSTHSSSTDVGTAAAGAASTTDYVLPATTSIVLTEADKPAAAAPTITPAAVDVPVEIVRHLDDAAAWAAPVGTADNTAAASVTAVPIAVVPAAGGPPPLAREPREKTPEAAAEPAPQGPPKLARESEDHHELSRSVMIERRVLSPDSSLHLSHEAEKAATALSATHDQKPAADDAQVSQSAAPTEIPVSVWQPEVDSTKTPTPAAPAVTDDAPLSVVLQPALSQQEKQPETPKDVPIDIPVAVQQSSEPAKDSAAATPAVQQDSAPTEIPVTVVKQPEEEPKAEVQQVLACELQQKPEEPKVDTAAEQQPQERSTAAAPATPEVPVATAAQQEKQQTSAVDGPVTTTSPTTAHAPMSLESTFQIAPQEEDFAQPPTMPRDRAMSIHERSLLAHESSGFQPGLEPLPENDDGNGEVHVASAAALEQARRRASVGPGAAGEAAIAAFQMPSTSCLFTVDEHLDESETPAPASTASPSESAESTTIASSIIDVTAPAEVAAAKPQEPSGVQWLTESESCTSAPEEHSHTPESPQTVVAAVPPTQQQEEAPPSDAAPTVVTESAAVTAAVDTVSPEITKTAGTTAEDAAPAVSSEPAVPSSPAAVAKPTLSSTAAAEVPPPTPKTPSGVSWITEPATTTTELAQSESQAPPQTPKTPQGDGWITEPSQPAASPSEPVFQLQPPPVETECVSAGPASPVPQTKSPGVTWFSEPATTATEIQAAPQTPKTPTGVTWISEPAAPATAAVAEPEKPVPVSDAPPQTPKTPTGVSWITEPAAQPVPTSGAPDVATTVATAAPATPPSVINITAPPELAGQVGGAAAPPKSPTSPGIVWASDSTRIGGNVEAAGAPPSPSESTFVVNAPWEGKDQAPAASAPDADGVTWITETPKEAAAAASKEIESAPRPPLARSESTRSERDPSTATDITVREATPQRRTLVPSASCGEEENLANGVMQEGQGTKVRKLSWADQQQSGAEDSFSAAIDDYEKKLNETTAQTRELVDLLCKTGGQITENSMKMSDVFNDAVQASVRSMLDQERKDRAAAALSPIAENGEPISREPPPQLIAGALPPNVDSVIVSCPELKYVTGSLVLENAHILVTDEESGLFLFTLDSKVVRHITNPLWKRASSPAIFKDRLKSYIIILMDCKDEEDGSWVRHIVKFTENLDYIEKVECPKWIREKTVISDRLAVNRYENIYYCANGELFSGLYELAPTGKWTELLYRQSESFIDMLAFAIIGPIQQILIVEGRRDHVLLCSIRESVCVDAKRMGICERPGALAKDESGRLFVMNRAQAAVQIVDTRVWAACRNMALVDKFVPHFSASFGMLVIPQKRAVKVHKYSFEWDD